MDSRIPLGEISRHPTSQCDPNGFVFTWRGDIYRAMSRRGAEVANKLFDSGVVESLVAKRLLIETERTGFQFDGFDLVLKHRRLPVITYPMEWCALMLQEALLSIANTQIELLAHGFEIEGNDADPWNVLFDGCTPRWIDFGSLNLIGAQGAVSHVEFLTQGVRPLRLLADGRNRIARSMLYPMRGPDAAESHSLKQDVRERNVMARIARRIRNFGHSTGTKTARDFDHWKKMVSQTGFPVSEKPVYSSDENIIAAISEKRCRTALVIGNRTACYIEEIARVASHTVVVSKSESDANAVHQLAKNKNLNLQSLVMRMYNPTPGLGVVNEEFAPASARLLSDLVFAGGLIDVLVFKRWLNFEQIVQTLALFCANHLLVEFTPMTEVPREWLADHPALEWYSAERFKDALGQRFKIVQQRELAATGGCLFVCEK